MEESSGQYPLVNVNRGMTPGSSQPDDAPPGSSEIGPHTESVDFDPRNLIPVPIVFCDDEGQIVWLNSAAEDLTGFSSHHAVGKAFTELFPEDKRADIIKRVLRWRRRGDGDLYLEEPIQTADQVEQIVEEDPLEGGAPLLRADVLEDEHDELVRSDAERCGADAELEGFPRLTAAGGHETFAHLGILLHQDGLGRTRTDHPQVKYRLGYESHRDQHLACTGHQAVHRRHSSA